MLGILDGFSLGTLLGDKLGSILGNELETILGELLGFPLGLELGSDKSSLFQYNSKFSVMPFPLSKSLICVSTSVLLIISIEGVGELLGNSLGAPDGT